MKKTIIIISVLFIFIILTATVVQADPPVKFDDEGNEVEWKKEGRCTRIQDGILTYSTGHKLYGTPLTLGYDPYGYNYQAHMFNGTYANVYLGGVGYPPYDGDDDAYLAANPSAASHWAWPYRNVELSMKWNDAWIANTDCDEDGKLDRHYDFGSYSGSEAWLTNHMAGSELPEIQYVYLGRFDLRGDKVPLAAIDVIMLARVAVNGIIQVKQTIAQNCGFRIQVNEFILDKKVSEEPVAK